MPLSGTGATIRRVKARDWWWQVSVQTVGSLIAAAVVYLVVVLAGVVTLNTALAIGSVVAAVAAVLVAAVGFVREWRRPMTDEEVARRLKLLELELEVYRVGAERKHHRAGDD